MKKWYLVWFMCYDTELERTFWEISSYFETEEEAIKGSDLYINSGQTIKIEVCYTHPDFKPDI